MTCSMRDSRTYILKGLLALAVTFLVVQFVGYKIFVDKVEQRFDVSSWGMSKYFLETCNKVDLPVFAMEPSFLRALRTGEGAIDLWNRGRYPVVTFGAIDPSVEELHNLMSRCDRLSHLELNSADPRDLSLDSQQNYRTLPSHYFMWRPNSAAPLLHLVAFYRRGDYLWHANADSRRIASLPINISHLTIGLHAGSYEKFSIKTDKFKGLSVAYPSDTSKFVWGLQHSKFLECDYPHARYFFTKYGRKNVHDMVEFRRKGRQLLSLVVTTLDSMGLPFWLSSGTCLGWFRQCDIIPYSKDVDIGIFIKDYREELITALENAGLKLVQQFGKVSDSFELSFAYDDVKLDIFFFYEEADHVWNGGTQANTAKKFKHLHANMCTIDPPSLCSHTDGIETLSLMTYESLRGLAPYTLPSFSSLAGWLPCWGALKHITLQITMDEDLNPASGALLEKIREGQLHSLVLLFGSRCVHGQQFIWDILETLASRDTSRVQDPMKLFAFSSEVPLAGRRLDIPDDMKGNALQSLCIWDTEIVDKTATQSLAKFLANNQCLHRLSIKQCTIQQHGIAHWLSVLSSKDAPRSGVLDVLELCEVNLSCAWNQLLALLANSTHLSTLTISYCGLTPDHSIFPDLCKVVKSLQHLAYLDLSGNRLSEALCFFMPEIVHHGSTLKMLNIGNTGLDEDGAMKLVDNLLLTEGDSLPLLDTLKISGGYWGPRQMPVLVEKFRRIAEYVNADRDDYGGHVADYVAQM